MKQVKINDTIKEVKTCQLFHNFMEGKIPLKQKRMVEAWIMIHKEELITLWNIMQEGKDYFKIEPLK